MLKDGTYLSILTPPKSYDEAKEAVTRTPEVSEFKLFLHGMDGESSRADRPQDRAPYRGTVSRREISLSPTKVRSERRDS